MTDILAPQVLDVAGVSPRELMRRRVRSHAGLLIGTGLLAAMVLIAVLAQLLAPHDPYAQELGRRLIRRSGTRRVPGNMRSAPTISAAIIFRASSTARASRC